MGSQPQPGSTQTPEAEAAPASDVSAAQPARKSPRARKPAPARKAARSLIDTAGPDPDASLDGIRLTIGVIGGTHGVNGELKLKVLTDHPEHLATLAKVYLGDSDTPTALEGVRFQGDQALIHLAGVTTPEQGKLLGGLKVRIDGSDALPLEEGEYFLFQLIGLAAVTGDGEAIGTVTDILETGAHDVLTIRPESGPDILVPNHPRYVLDIAPQRNQIVIELPVYAS